MGEKVEDVLKLIQEDGDSFAKRAEMYYKKRPELINFVEESYRAYRSLAERYDHLSRELQNANNTLASAFPDQYQFPMDDDDDYNTPKMQRKFQERPSNNSNIPQAPPKFPSKNIKAIIALTANSNRSNPPKTGPNSGSRVKKLPKSGLTISEAINEIDKLQKQILTLQTEKEFAKSSYESGYAKYWDIDEQIIGTQEKISKLQDEFEVAQVIEDDEARSLMAEAAIKSCNDTLAQLQEKQERAAEEAKAEYQKIREARDKLKSLKAEFLGDQTDASEDQVTLDETASGVTKSEDLELLRDKIKEHFDVSETASLSVLEMAEKIDELVNKVINLQSSMSSQTALIHSLRSETDELQSQVKSLEDDKANLIAGKTTLTDKLGEMENKLKGLQDLNDSLENQNSNLETQFKEAYPDLDNISREPLDAKSNEGEVEHHTEFKESKGSITYMELKNEIVQDEQKGDVITSRPIQEEEGKVGKVALLESKDEAPFISLTDDIQPQESRSSNTDNYQQHEPKPSTNDDYQQQEPKPSTTDNCGKSQPQETSNVKEEEVINPQTTHKQQPATQESIQEAEPRELTIKSKDEPNAPLSMPPPEENQKEEEPDWKQLFTDGLQGKEKVLLAEYTATLRNYKETKKKLCEVEKKNEENFSELEKQLKELKCSLTMRDEELHSLRQKLSVVQRKLDEYRYAKENYVEPSARTEKASPPPEEDDEDIKVIPPHEGHEISPVEQKLRTEMDQILEENLDFWMRFSASFGQVQKFQNVVQDLQTELAKLEKNSDKKEGNIHGDTHVNLSLKSDVRPIYKHLREIDTELTVWLEQSEKLKEELQRRFSQLCHIQEEIKHTLSTHAEDDDMKFTSFQAAKFQGEVANMQQENNKVADELQASMDYITSLQLEVERTTNRLNEELGFSSSRNQNESERSGSRARVPLRSFIFGVKPQKKKQSIFSCMHPGMINRRYHHLKSDKSP